MKNNHLIIMAGGVGSRFWPMSTVDTPKQFLDILGTGKSLLQLTAERFSEVCPRENIWIVTAEKYLPLVKDQLPELHESRILLEPCMRNTAPCIAYAAWKIKAKYPDANLVVSPADHIVIDTTEFQRVLNESLEFTSEKEAIVTLGMKPSRPETGYGYIQAELGNECITRVNAFKEKPNLETAKVYLDNGSYFWNAGIFVWNVNTIEKVFRAFLPEMAELFDKGNEHWFHQIEQEFITTNFPKCEKISVDYGIMEHAKEIYVYLADFGWSDLGTWGSLYDRLPKNSNDNAVIGDNVKLIDSEECVVHVPKDKKVVVQGLQNYIIAEKDGTLLICDKANEQQIGQYGKLFEK
ncbi:mannose-1-phosphate guanylyltransferase [Prolixibacteraceae bacterium JC049]|nr:mannose-1-phosphate guanylyltransferase [Prolixibacteraceae bacterium JC049]